MSRWTILTVLSLIRLSFGYQFQSMAALGPAVSRDLGLDEAQVGTLIGLYWAPGVLVALPGAWLGRRFGDKRAVVAGGVLTIIGGAACALAASYEALAWGRLVAGLGGIVMNVLAVKMTTDWFVGREIGFAMGALFGSFPLGIALGLALQAPLASSAGWPAVMASTAVLAAGIVAAIALLYRAPEAMASPSPTSATVPHGGSLGLRQIVLLSLAGAGLALYNGSFLVYVSYAPRLLTESVFGVASAGLLLGAGNALSTVFVPLGGHLTDRSGRPLTVLFSTAAAFSGVVALLPAAAAGAHVSLIVALSLLVSAFGALPISAMVALPSQSLPADRRAVGLGLFYTWFYLGAAACPALGGWLYDIYKTAASPIYLVAALGAVALALYWLFAALSERRSK